MTQRFTLASEVVQFESTTLEAVETSMRPRAEYPPAYRRPLSVPPVTFRPASSSQARGAEELPSETTVVRAGTLIWRWTVLCEWSTSALQSGCVSYRAPDLESRHVLAGQGRVVHSALRVIHIERAAAGFERLEDVVQSVTRTRRASLSPPSPWWCSSEWRRREEGCICLRCKR